MCYPCPYCAYTLVFSVIVCHFEMPFFLFLFQIRGDETPTIIILKFFIIMLTVVRNRVRPRPTHAFNNEALALRIDLILSR